MDNISKNILQNKLEEELERCKRILGTGYHLKVKWLPNAKPNLAGEVRAEYILIYDADVETALQTLKHEFIDYAVSEVIEPYMQVTNKLIALLNEKAYRHKERLVAELVRLI